MCYPAFSSKNLIPLTRQDLLIVPNTYRGQIYSNYHKIWVENLKKSYKKSNMVIHMPRTLPLWGTVQEDHWSFLASSLAPGSVGDSASRNKVNSDRVSSILSIHPHTHKCIHHAHTYHMAGTHTPHHHSQTCTHKNNNNKHKFISFWKQMALD